MRELFRKLHESGCFVIPNPWDAGSARYLASLGFPALATSSAGFAFSQGLNDSSVTAELAIEHARVIAAAVNVPVNCDFQAGYAHKPEGVARNVLRCAEAGVAGLSIEDATGHAGNPLYELPLAVARIRAARQALEGTGVLLTARAECFLTAHHDPLQEAIRRLQAYSEAGADVLYAPGPRRREDIKAIIEAVHPKPVNVLLLDGSGLRVADLAELGARRVSVGSALARAAWGGFQRAAKSLSLNGDFGPDTFPSFHELNSMF